MLGVPSVRKEEGRRKTFLDHVVHFWWKEIKRVEMTFHPMSASALPVAKPLFESTGLFDIPTPPDTSSSKSKPPSTDDDFDALIAEAERTEAASLRTAWGTPPPDLDEEPEETMEEHAIPNHSTLGIDSTFSVKPSHESPKGIESDAPENSVASCACKGSVAMRANTSASRLILTPPSDPLMRFSPPPLPPCLLPALDAETADGQVIQFRRRHRPKPALVSVSDYSHYCLHLLGTVNRAEGVDERTRDSTWCFGAPGDTPASSSCRSWRAAFSAEGSKVRNITSDVAVSDTRRLQRRFDRENRDSQELAKLAKKQGMWVDRYRPKKFADLLGEDVRASVVIDMD